MIKTSIPPTVPDNNSTAVQHVEDIPSSSSTPSSNKESVIKNDNEQQQQQSSSTTTNDNSNNNNNTANEKQSIFSKLFSKKSAKEEKKSKSNEKESISNQAGKSSTSPTSNIPVPTSSENKEKIDDNDIISSSGDETVIPPFVQKEENSKKKSDIDFQEKGNIELWNKNYEQALEYFSEALEVNPDNIEIHLSKAAVFNSSGLFSNAIKECKVTLEMANKKRNELDESGEEMIEVDQLLSKAYARMGTAYLGINKFKESKTCLENAITIQQCTEFEEMLTLLQELIDLNNKEAKDLFRLANDAYKSKQYDEAIQLYTESINIDQENNILFSNRSMCYIKLKRYIEALSDSEMAINIENKYGHHFYLPRYAKGNALYSLGRYQDAFDSYQDALKNRPDSDILKKKIKKTKLKIEKFGPIREINQPVESTTTAAVVTKEKKSQNKKQKKKGRKDNSNNNNNNIESNEQVEIAQSNDSIESNLENSTILENYDMGSNQVVNNDNNNEEDSPIETTGLSKVQQLIQRIEKDSPKKVEPNNIFTTKNKKQDEEGEIEQQIEQQQQQQQQEESQIEKQDQEIEQQQQQQQQDDQAEQENEQENEQEDENTTTEKNEIESESIVYKASNPEM